MLGASQHRRRGRHLRSRVSGERIAGGRPRPGGDSRLRVVSSIRRRRRHAARNAGALFSGSIGYGYSQSGRFLREFVRDGFNADERGRPAFDALMISSAGAGGGSFNHRFAMPGVAGNSVLSVLRPVDLPPFTDEGLLAQARAARVDAENLLHLLVHRVPGRAPDPSRIRATTAGRTRRWRRRRGSISWRGRRIRPGSCRWSRAPVGRRTSTSPTSPSSVGFRARSSSISTRGPRNESEPPSSQYPSIAKGELVALKDVHFPKAPSFPFATYMPQVWRMDYGPDYATTKVITIEPPRIGCALSGAGASGECGRQRRGGHPSARSGGAAGHLHGLEHHRSRNCPSCDILAAWLVHLNRFRSRRSSGNNRETRASRLPSDTRAARITSTGSNARRTTWSVSGSCSARTSRPWCCEPNDLECSVSGGTR